ncbi:MAG: hypothetical protein FGM55_10850 [Rhodoferax sp.]|nr:hypothetical protein [Rhodoferax sp.]
MTPSGVPVAVRMGGRSLILAVAAFASIAICVTAALAAYTLRQNVKREWAEQLASLSLILSEQASQTLFSAHTVLDSLTAVVKQAKLEDEAAYRNFVSQEAQHKLLVDRTVSNPIIDVATFVGKDGAVLNFTRSFPPARINLADRDYYQAHAADPAIDVYTSVPVRNKGNGKWVFYISRRVNNSQGEMLGLILVGVSVEVFSKFYERVGGNLGEGASLTLYRDDLTLMTRWPFVDNLVGKQNLNSATRTVIVDRKLSHDVVVTDSPRGTVGDAPQARMAAPRRLDRYPFIVTPVITEEFYLRGWRGSVAWISFTTAVSLLLVLLGARALLGADRRVRVELAERKQAQDSLRQAHEQLETRVAQRTAELTQEVGERKRAQEELARVNAHIAEVSHRAGMAEVANSVLHNVGNVLNSVNVSVAVLAEQLRRTPLADLPKAAALLREHRADLATFLVQDDRGRQLPGFIELLAGQWEQEHRVLQAETEQLANSLQHVKDVVSRQQSLSGQSGLTEALQIPQLVADVLAIHGSALERTAIRVRQSHAVASSWLGDRSKITQILLNLIVNAQESLTAAALAEPVIDIRSHLDSDGRLVIQVADNGLGISADALGRLFSYGFTTKPSGHGFGLHASALAAQEMGGALQAASDGPGRGACFTLLLPARASGGSPA